MFLFISVGYASPNFLTYQGRIIKSDGNPLEYANVSFIFEITSEDGSCVIYREQRNGINMVNSKGLFDVDIGSGTRTVPDSTAYPTYKLSDAFVNGVTHNCAGSGTWAATVSSYRKLKVQFHDGNGWQVISPDNTIRSVPFAMTAKSATQIGDKTINDFVLKSNAPGAACTAGQVVFWDGTNFSCVTDAGGAGVISDVLAGTGIAVSGTTSKTITVTFGTTAGTVAQGNDSRIANALQSSTIFAGDVSGTASSISVDRIKGVTVDSTAPTTGQVLRYDGAKWAAATLNAGTVTSVGVSVPSFLSASGGPITSSGTIAISLASQTGNTVFAAPNGSSGAPTFRTLSIADIFSSIGGLSFLNTSPSCAAGTALTYVSASDRIECASIAVDTANIADNAITTAKIADGAVTAAKLGSDVGAWSTSSGNVYRTTGTVGVGTSATSSVLTVGANSLTWPNFGLDVLGTNTSDLVRFKNTSSNTMVHIVADNGRNSALRFIEDGVAEYAIGRDGADDKFKIAFGANLSANNLMTLTSSGLVGFGNSSPVASLDLSSKTDAIYFPKGSTAQQPSSPAAGMIRYNTDSNAAEFYNGSSWVNLAAITSGGTMTNVSTITGGAAGINISAGGTNQNVTLSATGTGTVTTGSVMTITNSTASTAYNNGALVVSGGVGVSGNINSNGNMYVAGSIAAGTSLYSPLIYGSTAASGTLTLDSTSDATKGNILLAPSGGNVGIGTTSPSEKFQINGPTTNTNILISDTSLGNNYYIGNTTSPGLGLSGNTSQVWTGMQLALGSWGAFPVVFGTNNIERMRITNAGKVGIGTTSPLAQLHVATSGSGTTYTTPLHLSNNYSGAGATEFVLFDGAVGGAVRGDALWSNTVGNLWISPNAASKNLKLRGGEWTSAGGIDIDSNGSVGIGTNAPTSALEVSGDLRAGSGGNYLYYNGAADVSLRFAGRGSGGRAVVHDSGNVLSLNYAGDFSGGTQIGGPTVRIPGFLGIGPNVNDAAPLQIGHTVFDPNTNVNSAIMVGSSVTAAAYGGGILMKDATYYAGMWSFDAGATLVLGAGGTLSGFGTAAGQMTVSSNGRVGIGTYTPSGVLSLYNGSNNASLNIQATTGTRWWVTADTSGGRDIMKIGGGGGAEPSSGALNITSYGYVGLGTISPSYNLDVVGDINASGSVRAAGVALSSDARFKKNIEEITNPLGKVLALRGVEYDWRREDFPERQFSTRHQVGVIAQEVEKVFPELVDTDKSGYKSVNYPALIAPVIGAIKELYAMVSDKADKDVVQMLVEQNQKLIQSNAELIKQNAEIKARLEKLEKQRQPASNSK